MNRTLKKLGGGHGDVPLIELLIGSKCLVPQTDRGTTREALRDWGLGERNDVLCANVSASVTNMSFTGISQRSCGVL